MSNNSTGFFKKVFNWTSDKINDGITISKILINAILILASIVAGIIFASLFPNIPVLGKYSSIAISALGSFIGGILLGNLISIIAKAQNVVAGQNAQNNVQQALQTAQLNKEIDDLKKLNKDLEDKNKNLENSVILSFKILPKCGLTVLETSQKVQKYMCKNLKEEEKKVNHRPFKMEYRAVWSEDIERIWSYNLNDLRFGITGKTIQIYNAKLQIKPSYKKETWPMEGHVYKIKYPNDEKKYVEEILWNDEYDKLYKEDVDKFVDEEKNNLYSSFEATSGSDDPLTENLCDSAKQLLQKFFDGLCYMFGGYHCEIIDGDVPSDALDLQGLNDELNTLRLMNVSSIGRDEAKQRIINKTCSNSQQN